MGRHFAILATGVDNLTIDNVKIDTNRDGIDVDACKIVRISNCTDPRLERVGIEDFRSHKKAQIKFCFAPFVPSCG